MARSNFLFCSLVLLFLSFPFVVNALYGKKNSEVILLTDMNTVVKDSSSSIWIVEFFAPWCGHCVQAAPEVEKAATALKGFAKVGAVDMDKYQSLGSPYGVTGFPTFKIFVGGKPQDYNGPRTAAGIVDAVTNAIKAQAKARLSGGGGGSTGGSSQQKQGSTGGSSSKGSSGGSGSSSKGDPIEQLTDANFDSVVYNSDDMFLVAFVAGYCGHCQRLKVRF
jgi:protein disulfide-isomerase A6